MKLIQLKSQVDGYATINFGDIDMMAVLKSGDVAVLNGKSFTWDRIVSPTISDCPFYIGAMPIFSTVKLGNALAGTNITIATFDVEGKSYTIMAAHALSGQVINLDKSNCRTFRSGKIMDVSKYVFNAGVTYPAIFTTQEFLMFTFCDEIIANRLISCHFNQLKLVECPII